jgi:hypothetical protein
MFMYNCSSFLSQNDYHGAHIIYFQAFTTKSLVQFDMRSMSTIFHVAMKYLHDVVLQAGGSHYEYYVVMVQLEKKPSHLPDQKICPRHHIDHQNSIGILVFVGFLRCCPLQYRCSNLLHASFESYKINGLINRGRHDKGSDGLQQNLRQSMREASSKK